MIAGVAIASDPALIAKMRSRRGIVWQHLAARRMLDARWPPPTVTLRMNRQSKERTADRRAVDYTPPDQEGLYPLCFDDAEQIRIRLAQCDSPALSSLSIPVAASRLPLPSPQSDDPRNAVSLGGVETWSAIPRQPLTRGCRQLNWKRRASATAWFVCQSESRTGETCWRILSRRLSGSSDQRSRPLGSRPTHTASFPCARHDKPAALPRPPISSLAP